MDRFWGNCNSKGQIVTYALFPLSPSIVKWPIQLPSIAPGCFCRLILYYKVKGKNKIIMLTIIIILLAHPTPHSQPTMINNFGYFPVRTRKETTKKFLITPKGSTQFGVLVLKYFALTNGPPPVITVQYRAQKGMGRVLKSGTNMADEGECYC